MNVKMYRFIPVALANPVLLLRQDCLKVKAKTDFQFVIIGHFRICWLIVGVMVRCHVRTRDDGVSSPKILVISFSQHTSKKTMFGLGLEMSEGVNAFLLGKECALENEQTVAWSQGWSAPFNVKDACSPGMHDL